MKKKKEDYKRYLFLASILVSLGVIFSTSLKESAGLLGIIFIATGGLLFIRGLGKKREDTVD